MSAVARRIQYSTQVVPYNLDSVAYSKPTYSSATVTPDSIIFEEYTQTFNDKTVYTQSGTTSSAQNLNIVDNDIKKTYGCNSFLSVSANQGDDDAWYSALSASKDWQDYDDLTYEEFDGLTKTWNSDYLVSTTSTALISGSDSLLFFFAKNIGSVDILLSFGSDSFFPFKLTNGNALYFKANGILLNTMKAKVLSGVGRMSFLLAK